MSYLINFREMTVHINPLNVVEYLKSLNWRVLPRKNEAVKVLQREIGGKLLQVNIPMDKTLFDYKDAMYDSIATVAESEGKSLEEVFLYLLNPNSDISKMEEGINVGRRRNQTNYRKLYDNLYNETCAELADLKSNYRQLLKRYDEAVNKITELEKRVKTQAEIIEELEGDNSSGN